MELTGQITHNQYYTMIPLTPRSITRGGGEGQKGAEGIILPQQTVMR